MSRARTARCGTTSGYTRHQLDNEKPCDACASAKAAYDKRLRESPAKTKTSRLRARAQNRAEGRLRRMYPDVWRVLYAEEVERALAEGQEVRPCP